MTESYVLCFPTTATTIQAKSQVGLRHPFVLFHSKDACWVAQQSATGRQRSARPTSAFTDISIKAGGVIYNQHNSTTPFHRKTISFQSIFVTNHVVQTEPSLYKFIWMSKKLKIWSSLGQFHAEVPALDPGQELREGVFSIILAASSLLFPHKFQG